MPNEFMVIGENKDNEGELLVKGADGEYYEYDLMRERLSPVEPDDHWELFPNAEEATDEY